MDADAGYEWMYWQAHLRIAQERKLPLMLGRIERRLGLPLRLLHGGRRAPGDPLVHVRFMVAVEPPAEIGRAVFQALVLVRRLGRDVRITGPDWHAGSWGFIAASGKPSLAGLASVQVEVSGRLWPRGMLGG
ncbi:MAG TPA: hypothetical protein VGE07_06690 [Herpetosiphonaceae bacterium]